MVIDDDAPELTAELIAKAKPAREVLTDAQRASFNKGGRPRKGDEKVAVSLRIDRPVVEAFKGGGPGWQTRMNDALRAWIGASASARPEHEPDGESDRGQG